MEHSQVPLLQGWGEAGCRVRLVLKLPGFNCIKMQIRQVLIQPGPGTCWWQAVPAWLPLPQTAPSISCATGGLQMTGGR